MTICELLDGRRHLQGHCEFHDAVADALVEQLAVLIHIGVIADQGTAGSAESLIKSCQVKVEQFLEYGKVVFCKIVDAAFYRPTISQAVLKAFSWLTSRKVR